jgi:hypothetical protein
VFEWLKSDLKLSPLLSEFETYYQIRGGAFDSSEKPEGLINDWAVFPARAAAANIGFRCAKSAIQ